MEITMSLHSNHAFRYLQCRRSKVMVLNKLIILEFWQVPILQIPLQSHFGRFQSGRFHFGRFHFGRFHLAGSALAGSTLAGVTLAGSWRTCQITPSGTYEVEIIPSSCLSGNTPKTQNFELYRNPTQKYPLNSDTILTHYQISVQVSVLPLGTGILGTRSTLYKCLPKSQCHG